MIEVPDRGGGELLPPYRAAASMSFAFLIWICFPFAGIPGDFDLDRAETITPLKLQAAKAIFVLLAICFPLAAAVASIFYAYFVMKIGMGPCTQADDAYLDPEEFSAKLQAAKIIAVMNCLMLVLVAVISLGVYLRQYMWATGSKSPKGAEWFTEAAKRFSGWNANSGQMEYEHQQGVLLACRFVTLAASLIQVLISFSFALTNDASIAAVLVFGCSIFLFPYSISRFLLKEVFGRSSVGGTGMFLQVSITLLLMMSAIAWSLFGRIFMLPLVIDSDVNILVQNWAHIETRLSPNCLAADFDYASIRWNPGDPIDARKQLQVNHVTTATEINFISLTSFSERVSVHNTTAGACQFPQAQYLYETEISLNPRLNRVSFPQLSSLHAPLQIVDNPVLASLSFPQLTAFNLLNFSSNQALAYVEFASLLMSQLRVSTLITDKNDLLIIAMDGNFTCC